MQKVKFRPPPISVTICTDASKQGWGAHSSLGGSLRGKWSREMASFHINILEMAAVYLALRRFRFPRNAHIALHSDNMTVVNCLSRLGSARSKPLNSWVVSILSLLRDRGIFLTTCHVAGVRNVVADALSRSVPLKSEWSLDDDSFRLLCRRTFYPQVDLFATRENRKVEAFISPVQDHLAVGVDAFAIDWN